jgi:hypothetical protein
VTSAGLVEDAKAWPETASGEHHGARADVTDVEGGVFAGASGAHAGNLSDLVDQRVDRDGVLHDLDVRREQRRRQDSVQLGPNGVPSGVHDASM